MQTEAFTELFPLFNAASQETLEWLLSVAVQHDYPPNRAVLMEDSWGNAVYFISSGWVKVRRLSGENNVTLARQAEHPPPPSLHTDTVLKHQMERQ